MHRLLFALALAACSGAGDSAEELDYGRTQVTDLGSWTVSYVPRTDPIPAIDLFALDVEISGESDVTGLFVDVDASMPQHNHGMNTDPVVGEVGNGMYQVEGMSFHMTGDWELLVVVDDGNSYERAFFWIDCCEPPQ